MPLFTNASPFDADVEKATNEMNTTEDWSLILDICDKVGRQQNGASDCLKSIVKRLYHKVPFVTMQALTLLDACVNNCGRPFHLEICSRDFVSDCRTLISHKAHPKVAQKLRLLIKGWAEMPEFKADAALSLIPSFYESLKKEGHDFAETDAPKSTPDLSQVKKEEDDLAKAIALSLQENENKSSRSSSNSGGASSSLYPMYSTPAGSQANSRPVQKEIRKVRALYDFEAAEDNELTFKAGELICVLDDSDPNWWKGSNHRGEGLFPANFVTADLSVEPEPEVKEKKTVQFNEEVEVNTVQLMPGEGEISEVKIDEVLGLLQNADPTGEIQADSMEMLTLEEQCKAMGPLIDAELEKIDKKHANLVELNKKVMDALQMYHTLMKETPAYPAYPGMKLGQMVPGAYNPTQGPAAAPAPIGGLHQAPGAGPGPVQPTQPVYMNQGQYMVGATLPANQSLPSMSIPGNSVGAQAYSTSQPLPTGQQSFPSSTHMQGYSSIPSVGAVPSAVASNGNPPMQHSYPQSNMNVYQPPPPQQPLL